jgi:hypothetical protein
MATKRRPASEVAQWRSPVDVWIDHASISLDDVTSYEAVEKLTLWNVTYPVDLFSRMPQLWWLDIRGGTAKSFHSVAMAQNLRYLCINQIRGLDDLSDIPSLEKLELLTLYGLSKVKELPDLTGLSYLRRVEIGQMKGLQSLKPVWEAHQLEEILLLKEVPAENQDIGPINCMPNLKTFSWDAIDIPARRFMPIREGVTVPRAKSLHAAEWFGKKDQ